jgi:hypothetical protein
VGAKQSARLTRKDASRCCPSEYSRQSSAIGASPPDHILSWNSPVVQSVDRLERIALLAWRARFTVSPCRGPAGFRSEAASAVASNRDPNPLVDFGVPPES